MLELALNYGHKPVHLDAIAQQQNLSPKYLHSLLSSLKNAGLIHCIRGKSGGYVLTRNPDEIHLNKVMVALEGPLVFAECVPEPELCADSDGCVTREFWGNLGSAIETYLSDISLGSLSRGHMKNNGKPADRTEPEIRDGCQKSRDNMVNLFNSDGNRRKFMKQF